MVVPTFFSVKRENKVGGLQCYFWFFGDVHRRVLQSRSTEKKVV